MSRTRGRSQSKMEKDHYPTPLGAIVPMVKVVADIYHKWGDTTPSIILDLGAGDGRIAFSVQEVFHSKPFLPFRQPRLVGVELPSKGKRVRGGKIRMVRGVYPNCWDKVFGVCSDIVHCPINMAIVSNPPFSQADTFFRHAVSMLHTEPRVGSRSVVAMLQKLNFLGSKKRKDFWKKYPPSYIVILVPRPGFVGGGTDAAEYGWFIWKKESKSKMTKIVIGEWDKLRAKRR